MPPFAHNKILILSTPRDLNLDQSVLKIASLPESYRTICGGVLSVSLLKILPLHKYLSIYWTRTRTHVFCLLQEHINTLQNHSHLWLKFVGRIHSNYLYTYGCVGQIYDIPLQLQEKCTVLFFTLNILIY